MFLAQVFAENFRIFGSEKDNSHLRVDLAEGLNVLAGENDSGKTALVDAVRYVLWTTSQDYLYLNEEDFHVSGANRVNELRIRLTFRALSTAEQGRFLEWLTVEDGVPCLHITMRARLLSDEESKRRRGRRTDVDVRCGRDGDGPRIEGELREFLRVTYLRPLRDAEAELSPGRNSRLSQVLRAHPEFTEQAKSDFDEKRPDTQGRTLLGIVHEAEYRIRENEVIRTTQDSLNDEYLKHFTVGDEQLSGAISVARTKELRQILEKLELSFAPPKKEDLPTRRGLGANNILFMATELLLLGGDSDALPLLLIEEPEAHLHAQRQLRLMEFLEERATSPNGDVQMLLTTHSPNLASKANLESVILMHEGRAYPLGRKYTKLAPSDYRFLERFLDVTRANLFFAKGVVLVEGDAENLLLPTIARLIGRPFSEHGVSVVNVGHRGLFRYSRIFQRRDGSPMPSRVARICDRDIVPDAAKEIRPSKDLESSWTPEKVSEHEDRLKDGDDEVVHTFVSPRWTFEFDLAVSGLAEEVYVATQLAKKAKDRTGFLNAKEQATIIRNSRHEFAGYRCKPPDDQAVLAYEPLAKKQASKAETAQILASCLERQFVPGKLPRNRVPGYLVKAIDFVTRNDGAAGVADA